MDCYVVLFLWRSFYSELNSRRRLRQLQYNILLIAYIDKSKTHMV